MTDLSKLNSFTNQSKPRLISVLTGILLIVGGFWIYNNFTRTEEAVKKEEISIEQLSEQENKKEGLVAGDSIEPGIGGGSETSAWAPRDIDNGSLKDNESYTVQAGDTLWEIAEGKYGSGFEWYKIRDANKDRVGFLANGTQALIEVGTVLTLPQS